MEKLQDEEQFQKICSDLEDFRVHVEVVIDSIHDNVYFQKCSNCNRPTIDHIKPVHEECTQELIDDPMDILDIEDMIKERQEFKDAYPKLVEKEEREEMEEMMTCYICGKFCETQTGLDLHKISVHENKGTSENVDDVMLACDDKNSEAHEMLNFELHKMKI